MSENQPSYYAIIPANVRYCKKLEPSAKLLYGEITALSNKEGYCWASNEFLADLYEVDIRTIQRWIESLKLNKFIFVEIVKVKFETIRKIHIIKESFTKGQKCHTREDKNVSSRDDKNDTHNNTSVVNAIKQQQETPSAVVVLSEETKKKLSQLGKISSKQIAHWEKSYTEAQILTALQLTLEKKRDSSIGFFNSALVEGWQPSIPRVDIRKEILKNFKHGEKYNQATCWIDANGIGFTRGNKYEDVKFKDFDYINKFKLMLSSFGIEFPGEKTE